MAAAGSNLRHASCFEPPPSLLVRADAGSHSPAGSSRRRPAGSSRRRPCVKTWRRCRPCCCTSQPQLPRRCCCSTPQHLLHQQHLPDRASEVLPQFKWPETLETDFVYSASSIGTSINPQFIANFASATGKRSNYDFDSEESDPEWGCWTAGHERKKPSISLLFPTIERVKTAACGVQLSRYLLSLPEKTWQRLGSTGIFHDAIPHPHDRIGHPMHVKVAQRRFQSRRGGHSFGWTYCGSHNFSPAAWGQPLRPPPKANPTEVTRAAPSGPRLHICNYELGIILIVPPPGMSKVSGRKHGIANITLPFVIPAPRYQHSDRPATPLAMREAMAEACIPQSNDFSEETDEEIPDEDDEHVVELSDCSPEDKEEEKIYAETLWGQVDSSEPGKRFMTLEADPTVLHRNATPVHWKGFQGEHA